MFLVSYTMGEDPYDHTKIGDYSRRVFREEQPANWTCNEWHQGCARSLERSRCSWYSIQMISLLTGEVLINHTKVNPELERKRINVKSKPSPPVYGFKAPTENWATVDQQPEEPIHD